MVRSVSSSLVSLPVFLSSGCHTRACPHFQPLGHPSHRQDRLPPQPHLQRPPRPSSEAIAQFILDQLDRAGLGHKTFTAEALALIGRSGEVLLRRTRNLCLSTLMEAVRNQTRIVDLKQLLSWSKTAMGAGPVR
jgi:hypothetical protein